MHDSHSPQLAESPPKKAGIWAIVLFVALALGSAFVSLVVWILGVGVPQPTHNYMGILFAAINVIFVVVGAGLFEKRHRLAAILSVMLIVPACVAAVVIGAWVFRL